MAKVTTPFLRRDKVVFVTRMNRVMLVLIHQSLSSRSLITNLFHYERSIKKGSLKIPFEQVTTHLTVIRVTSNVLNRFESKLSCKLFRWEIARINTNDVSIS